MRDDLTLGPAFDANIGEEDHPLHLRPSHTETVQPAKTSRAWRIFSYGAMGACVLGLGLGLMTLKGRAATTPAKAAAPSVTAANFKPIKAAYAAPDRDQVARALDESKRLMSSEGLSGLARASIVCFDRLSREPAYSLMDYCLALDMLGAQAYAQAAGDTAPPSTYFGQGPVRRQAAVQMLIAGQTDANSRLIDTNRLVQELVTQAQLAAAGPPEPILEEASAPEAPAAVAVAEIAPPAPPPPPAPPKLAVAPAPKIATPVLVHAAKPPAVNRPLLRRPVKSVRAEPKAKLTKKAALQPVRAHKPVKKPAAPTPRIAHAPVNAEPKQSWPDILLTRLQSEGRNAEPQSEARTPPSEPLGQRQRVRPGVL